MKKENKIEKLLEKYLEGETSIKDEKILSEYFQTQEVKPEWLIYKDMFSYFEESKKEETYQDFMPQTKVTKSLFYNIQKYVAVVMIAIIGTMFYYQQPSQSENLGTYDDPELALEETMKVFNMISLHLNSPNDEMKYLQTLEDTKTQYINKINP
jgi:hypothetical protein